ncbi:MAG: carboxypeptidase-like regulatory domain-containing protein, partial [Saprospiraceae bacterium]|nr:carboxypeptidase-like regulatory domain-containing protein [Saprospiraceae bacterium]
MLTFIFTVLHFDLSAQNHQTIEVRGKIVDNRAKGDLIGASVLVKGSENGTITDYEGNFQLN